MQPEESVPSLERGLVPQEEAVAAHPAGGLSLWASRDLCTPFSAHCPAHFPPHVTTGPCPLPATSAHCHQPGALPFLPFSCPVSCCSKARLHPECIVRSHRPFPTRVRACWDLSRPCLTATTSPGCDTWLDADALRTCFGACEFSQNGVGFVQNTELGAENLRARVGSEPSFLGAPTPGACALF